jgi:hypothetical protein
VARRARGRRCSHGVDGAIFETWGALERYWKPMCEKAQAVSRERCIWHKRSPIAGGADEREISSMPNAFHESRRLPRNVLGAYDPGHSRLALGDTSGTLPNRVAKVSPQPLSAACQPCVLHLWCRRLTRNWARERANEALMEATSSSESFSLSRASARRRASSALASSILSA